MEIKTLQPKCTIKHRHKNNEIDQCHGNEKPALVMGLLPQIEAIKR